MRTIFQQVVVGTTALAIAAILLVVEGRPSDKILKALGAVFLGTAIYVLAPTIWAPVKVLAPKIWSAVKVRWSAVRPRRRELLVLTGLLIALRLLNPVQLAPPFWFDMAGADMGRPIGVDARGMEGSSRTLRGSSGLGHYQTPRRSDCHCWRCVESAAQWRLTLSVLKVAPV